jgi:hypothetical protein
MVTETWYNGIVGVATHLAQSAINRGPTFVGGWPLCIEGARQPRFSKPVADCGKGATFP